MMDDRPRSTRRRRWWIGLACVCFLAALYLGWSFHRFTNRVMIAEGANWPRPAPYPDRWLLLQLNDYYDQRYPGGIKLHGEQRRVQATVLIGAGAAAAAGATCLLIAGPRRRTTAPGGFEVN
jgi:hypothetical protein